jgi:hypothetical protein
MKWRAAHGCRQAWELEIQVPRAHFALARLLLLIFVGLELHERADEECRDEAGAENCEGDDGDWAGTSSRWGPRRGDAVRVLHGQSVSEAQRRTEARG